MLKIQSNKFIIGFFRDKTDDIASFFIKFTFYFFFLVRYNMQWKQRGLSIYVVIYKIIVYIISDRYILADNSLLLSTEGI